MFCNLNKTFTFLTETAVSNTSSRPHSQDFTI